MTAAETEAEPSPKVAALAAEAAEAATLRALSTNPDVVALRVEQVRDLVDRTMWSAIILGLGFTMVNVQVFAAAGAKQWSPEWWAAWLLDPMVSLALIAVLLAEQTANRWGVEIGRWGRSARWVLLGATYTMNTWEAIDAAVNAGGAWSQVVLHSVPPLLVFFAAEAVTDLREALGTSITVAADWAAARAKTETPARDPLSMLDAPTVRIPVVAARRGTLFIDDTPTIPFPVVSSPPPREEEAEEPEEPQENAGEDAEEETEPPAPTKEQFPNKKLAWARAVWEHERALGRTRHAAWINDWIDSDRYVKKEKHIDAWEREWQERHQRALSVVGGR